MMTFLHIRTYAEKGSTDAGVVVSNKKVGHTIVATFRGDGSTLSAFSTKHRNINKKRKQKAIKGMNATFTLKYIDEVLAPNIRDAKILITDNLRCHHNRQVLTKTISLGLRI